MSKKNKKQNNTNTKQQQQPNPVDDKYPFIRVVGNNVLVEVNVKPNAKESEIVGIEEGLLKISIDSSCSSYINFFSIKLKGIIGGTVSIHKLTFNVVELNVCEVEIVTDALE